MRRTGGKREAGRPDGLGPPILASSVFHLLLLVAGMTVAAMPSPGHVPGIVEVALVSFASGRSAPAPSHPPGPRETPAKPSPVPAPTVSPPRASDEPKREVDSPEPPPAVRTEVPIRVPPGAGAEAREFHREGGGIPESPRAGASSVEDGSGEGEPAPSRGDGTAGRAVGIAGEGDDGRSDGRGAAVLGDRIRERIVYPAEAVRRGQEGEVLLRIRIDPGGVPREVRVARSSGVRILDEAARRGVIKAAPLPSDPGWVEVPVRFSLR